MDHWSLLACATLILLFMLSALISASETALIGLGRIRLAHAIERGGPRGQALEAWKHDPNRLLTIILILNNAITIAATTLAAFLAVHWAEQYGWDRARAGTLMGVAVGLIIIVFGEVFPKVMAIHRSEAIALRVIRPLVWVERGLRPLSRFMVWVTSLALAPFGIKTGKVVPMVTEEEIHALIQLGADEGLIEEQEHRMLSGVIQLADTEVGEIMVPRSGIMGIHAADPIERILDQVVELGYSRMPVYQGDLDHILGVIYTKDVIAILQHRNLIVLQDILRPATFVPRTKKVDELLREFQRGHLQMAIVVDTAGKTLGLVTLEDVLEEIVGEIRDEYDVSEVPEN